jgi:hypothetical protein
MKMQLISCLIVMLISTVSVFSVSGTIVNENKENVGGSLVTSSIDWSEQDKLSASDGASGDQFGYSVDIDGDYAIMGARQDDTNIGSAYIFKRSGTAWSQQAKLVASDGYNNEYFGSSVSISGDYAIVGARYDTVGGPNSGSAYIFKRSGSTWTQEDKISASDGDDHDEFGVSVAIDGDYAVVGAYRNDDGGSESGSAYIFKRSGTTWSQQEKLVSSDAAMHDYFAHSVSINGDYTVIGAYGDDTSKGAVYVFKRSDTAWSEQAKLVASDGYDNEHFGFSVDISNDYFIAGARYDAVDGPRSGSAYIFKRNGEMWAQEDKISASDSDDYDEFGFSVAIDSDYAVVGAYKNDDGGSDSGSAYIFKRSGATWTEETKLLASDGASTDVFGYSVSIYNTYAIIGAKNDDGEKGSAYIFVKPLTKLEIQDATGVIGFSASIKNVGSFEAENVIWQIKFEGGFVFSPAGGITIGGPIDIPPGSSNMINSRPLGLGGFLLPLNIVISAEADNANPVNLTVPAKLFIFFVII